MGQVVVFPQTAFLAGMAATTAMATVVPVSLTHVLQHRKQALEQFAQTALSQSAFGIGLMRSMAVGAGLPPYRTLEGIGAIIFDEDTIDRIVLETTLGATVFDNVLIPLVQPVGQGTAVANATTLPNFWHLNDINIQAARAKHLTGQGVLVGVLDTGIDPNHPEFAGKTVHFQEFDQLGSPVGSGAHDTGTHGTHVSGLIAGLHAGVASQADLAVAAVLTIPTPFGNSGWLAQIAAGLNWLLTHPFRGSGGDPGVDVVNASLGASGYNNYLYSALATARFSPGTLMVAAIGNSGHSGINNHGSPGNYDIVVGVGATDTNHNVASFSDWGTVIPHGGITKPDLCAPGDDVWSSIPGGAYQSMKGTSMASPVACGVAALLLQQNPALSLNVSGLQQGLLSLTVPLTGSTSLGRGGRGRLDLTHI